MSIAPIGAGRNDGGSGAPPFGDSLRQAQAAKGQGQGPGQGQAPGKGQPSGGAANGKTDAAMSNLLVSALTQSQQIMKQIIEEPINEARASDDG